MSPRFLLLAASALVSLATVSAPALAETPRDFLTRFEQEAGATASAERGARFFATAHGGEWRCATCHGDRPTLPGRHAKTDKPIAPLAPAANPERLTDAAKVDKWFRRNCNDTLGRACTAIEKADVTAWLMALR